MSRFSLLFEKNYGHDTARLQIGKQLKCYYSGNCNFFFDNVERVKDDLDEDTYNDYCGQARVIRAFLYLRLVQGFGDVPLTTSVLSADEWPARESADKVMEFILSELDKAIEELRQNQEKQIA